jgi:hypothetical protein
MSSLAERRLDIARTRVARLQRAADAITKASRMPLWHSEEVRVATVDQLRMRMAAVQRELREALAEHDAAEAAMKRAMARQAKAKADRPLRIIPTKPRAPRPPPTSALVTKSLVTKWMGSGPDALRFRNAAEYREWADWIRGRGR